MVVISNTVTLQGKLGFKCGLKLFDIKIQIKIRFGMVYSLNVHLKAKNLFPYTIHDFSI